MDQDTVQALFSAFIVVATMLLVGFPVHEALHAWTAMKLGDNTARFMGRVTLDPRAHLDQFGALVLAGTAILSAIGPGGILFGWAKPTPVSPMNMRHGRQGHALVAFAGPASNLVVAVITAIVFRILYFEPDVWNAVVANPLGEMLLNAAWLLLSLNILLFVFNLVPVPPLDGWSVLKGIVPASAARQLEELEVRYASVIPMLFFGLIILIVVSGGSLLGTVISSIRSFLVGF